jgi:transcriptional regulator with XRE-family HTH domain
MSFGEVLKELRAERGITQEKLARDLDIPETTIRRLETSRGKPRTERINLIASYFGVSTDRLLGRESKESFVEETESDAKRKKGKAILEKIKEEKLDHTLFLLEQLNKE